MKAWIKRSIMYSGTAETSGVRSYIAHNRRAGWPYCPEDEGDLLYLLARKFPAGRALEVGFATGSTAGYILTGMKGGHLTSVDYNQDNHEREGVRLVAEMGLSTRHTLVERDSTKALPEMHSRGDRFDLVFLDGWKTFDHVWVDTFFCARMLESGGYIMFDDARMPAVRKCISILENYYQFERIRYYGFFGGWRQRLWHLMTNRTLLPPYVALKKTTEIGNTPAGSQFDFWKSF